MNIKEVEKLIVEGTDLYYRKVASNDRVRHFRVLTVNKVWVAKSTGLLTINVDTVTVHGTKEVPNTRLEGRNLRVEGITVIPK